MNARHPLIPLIFAMAMAGCNPPSENVQAPVQPIPVKVRAVETTPVGQTLRLSGTIHPFEKAGLSFKVPGRIAAIRFEEGDRVKKGDLAAELETGDYELQMRMADARVKAMAPEFERQKSLLADRAITPAAFEKFEAEYKVATYQLDLARRQLEDCRMIVPFDGEVAMKKADKGELASPERVILVVFNMHQAEAEFGVPDMDIGRFAIGGEMTFTIDAVNREPMRGEVVRIGSMPDPVSRTYTVRVRLPNAEGKLKAGMIVKMDLPDDREDAAPGIPLSAVMHSSEDGPHVFVVQDGRALKKQVLLGRMQSRLIEIRQGLEEGDLLVIRGQQYLRDGAPVNVIG